MHVYVCLSMSVRIRCVSPIDRDMFRASRNRRSSVGGQVIWFFEFCKVEDPEHLFGEGKCLLTHYVPFTL
jgi:hypothetical protein